MAQRALRHEPGVVLRRLGRRPDGPVLTTTKTKRSHVVDLDPDSFAVLAEYAETVMAAPDGFVFSDDGGTAAWKPNRVTKAFLRHRRAAGLRPFRLHDLRHFMATEMLDAGVPIVVVSRRLDHQRVSTTLDKYAHAVPGRRRPRLGDAACQARPTATNGRFVDCLLTATVPSSMASRKRAESGTPGERRSPAL